MVQFHKNYTLDLESLAKLAIEAKENYWSCRLTSGPRVSWGIARGAAGCRVFLNIKDASRVSEWTKDTYLG